MKNKSLWFELGEQTSAKLLNAVYHRHFECVLVRQHRLSLLAQVPPPTTMGIVLWVDSAEALSSLPELAATHRLRGLLTDDVALLPALRAAARTPGLSVCLLHHVVDDDSLQASLRLAELVDVLLIDFKDPTNIPLELVLASTQASDTRIAKRVRGAADGVNSAMTMEEGAGILCLRSDEISEIGAIDAAFSKAQTVSLPLVPAQVTRISPAGMGDRVCIDTTSMLRQDEGMLVGSTSAGGLLTCSETHYLPYMDLRPFRVNAGAVHLYVWGPDNRTYYLSDLRAGSEVLAVSSQGVARTVTIGRLKIERRPLLCIEAVCEGATLNTFIQDDWHVRMMGSKGEIRPSREVEVGDHLLAYRDVPGRHVGLPIQETIREV